MRPLVALSLVVALAASACGGSAHAKAAPPAAGPNPDVVPAVITPAYVDAVFRVLDHLDGDASRALIAAHAVTPTVLRYIRAVYNDPLYAQEVKIAQESLGGDLRNVRRPPGDVRTTVLKLISASPSCIFVETSADYSAVLYKPGPPAASGYWALRPKQRGIDPDHLNPTPWALSFNAVYLTPTSIPDQCAAS
jgi:hypothetical protein